MEEQFVVGFMDELEKIAKAIRILAAGKGLGKGAPRLHPVSSAPAPAAAGPGLLGTAGKWVGKHPLAAAGIALGGGLLAGRASKN